MLEKFHRIKQADDEESLIRVYHTLMKEYGFISVEQCKKLPIPLVLELLDMIESDYKKTKARMPKGRR
jgi:hypothetical protein